ncbi:MAG: hypothetical protein RQ847_05165 [Wenzhouxiangellaceae bacterium]|nr:hypothetical protein [Wenzhouxiangellaceae bacterium]
MKSTLITIAAAVLLTTANVAAQSPRAGLLAAGGRTQLAVRHDLDPPRYERRHDRYDRYEQRGPRHHDHRHHGAHLYAEKAVRQAREARRLGYYSDHPRWSMSFERHFRWALETSTRRLEREEYRRARKLRELRAYYNDRHRHRYGHH